MPSVTAEKVRFCSGGSGIGAKDSCLVRSSGPKQSRRLSPLAGFVFFFLRSDLDVSVCVRGVRSVCRGGRSVRNATEQEAVPGRSESRPKWTSSAWKTGMTGRCRELMRMFGALA